MKPTRRTKPMETTQVTKTMKSMRRMKSTSILYIYNLLIYAYCLFIDVILFYIIIF